MPYVEPPQETFSHEKHYNGYYDSSRVNARKRQYRLTIAREKGRHTKKQWLEMVSFFENTCCRCLGESNLSYVEKDHILPIYMGGSDGLDNLQPLCARCNSSKGNEQIDWRPQLAEILNKTLPKLYTQSEVCNNG